MGAPPSSTSIRFVESVMELISTSSLSLLNQQQALCSRGLHKCSQLRNLVLLLLHRMQQKRLNRRLRRRLHRRPSTKLRQTRRRWQHFQEGSAKQRFSYWAPVDAYLAPTTNSTPDLKAAPRGTLLARGSQVSEISHWDSASTTNKPFLERELPRSSPGFGSKPTLCVDDILIGAERDVVEGVIKALQSKWELSPPEWVSGVGDWDTNW